MVQGTTFAVYLKYFIAQLLCCHIATAAIQCHTRKLLMEQVKKFSDKIEKESNTILAINSGEGLTSIECVLFCLQDDECQSVFFYKEGSNVCQLKNNVLDELTEPVDKPGARYYRQIPDCAESFYLISGPWRVSDEQITAFSEFIDEPQHYYGTERSRLDSRFYIDGVGGHHTGSWSAQSNTPDQYIQVELQFKSRITGIATQGRNLNDYNGCCLQWVTKFRLLYSMDGNNWQYVIDHSCNAKEFIGNSDSDTVVTNMVRNPFTAKYIRINPVEWMGHISLRYDVLGCLV